MSFIPPYPPGQATMANSAPVVLSSDQSDVKVTLDGETVAIASGTITAVTAITNALPAGTNNIGDVDILTVPADPFGVNADAASATGSISAKLRFIASTGIPITGTVTVGSHAVTNAGTFVTQENGAALTALQLMDNVVAVLGTDTYTEATSSGNVIAAVRRDADTTLVNTTNEFGPLQMDANGRLKVEVFSGETLPVSLTSTTITGSVAVTQSGTWDEVGINDSGNSITVDNGGTFVVQENGAALTALQVLDNTIFVDNAGFTDNSSSVTVAGFYFDDVAGTALTENDVAAARIDSKRALINVIEDATTRGQRMVVNAQGAILNAGEIAHDGADGTTNPQKMGGRAIAHGTNPTAVAADDRTNWYFNRHGIPFTLGGHPNTIRRTVYISDATGAQTDASIVGTINAGTKVVLTQITVTLDSATTATGGVAVKVGFGASTIPADSSTGANGIILDHKGIAAGSGVSVGDGSGIIGIGADGEELRLTCEDPVGGGVSISFSYFTIES